MYRIFVNRQNNRVVTAIVLTDKDDVAPATVQDDKLVAVYEVEKFPETEKKDLHNTVIFYDGKNFTVNYELNHDLCYARINDREAKLRKTDYKVIKAMEQKLSGLTPDYDAEALNTERQLWRDEINETRSLLELD